MGREVSVYGPDGTELGVLAQYERPGKPDQLNIVVRSAYRRRGVAMRILDKAAEEWGRDWLLSTLDGMLETEPESFSEAGRALWLRWSALHRP